MKHTPVKIELTKQQRDFLDTGNVAKTKNGEKWIYFPFYYKSTLNHDVYEMYTFDELPEGMKKYFKELNK